MFRVLSFIYTNCRSCSFCVVKSKLSSDSSVLWSKQRFSAGLLLKGPVSSSVINSSSASLSGSKKADKTKGMAEATQQESSGSSVGGGGGSGTSVVGNGGGDRSKCVFCKIVDGKESNEIYYQDDEIVVFQDIRPAAKYHFLVVTREHIKDCKCLGPSHRPLLERLVQVGNQVLQEQMQKDGGGSPDQVQKVMGFHWPPFGTVSHLHLHILAPTNSMGFLAKNIFRPGIWFVTADYVRERLEKMGAAGTGTQ